MRTEKTFAFGSSMVDDCSCPAMTAGFNPSGGDETLQVAEEYDEIMRGKMEKSEGTVAEDMAREAWLEAIERVRQACERGRLNDGTFTREPIKGGNKVAEELGWL